MKKIFISFAIMTTVTFSIAATKQIDKMIDSIRKPRQSLDTRELEKVKDPFAVEKVNTGIQETVIPVFKKPKPKFSLSAIVNNRAYINGSWHEEGGMIMGYKLAHVGTRGVVLTVKKEIVTLYLPEKTDKNRDLIKMKEGKQ